MAFEFMSVPQFARETDRSRQAALKMVQNGTLAEAGYKVARIKPRKGSTMRKWIVGVPVEDSVKVIKTYLCHCPGCGKRWVAKDVAPQDCGNCGSTEIELSEAA